jgi:hypothetical protein
LWGPGVREVEMMRREHQEDQSPGLQFDIDVEGTREFLDRVTSLHADPIPTGLGGPRRSAVPPDRSGS